MKNLLFVTSIQLIILLTSLSVVAQTACVTFRSVNASFNGASNQIIYAESDIVLRFIDGFNGPAFSDVTIGPLTAWSGIYGNDNFSGSKIQWAYAKTNVLLNQLSHGLKTITFDYNSYGEKIIMEDIQVWSQGSYNLTYDTTSLINGGIVTIIGYVDSIGIGASFHNDYVVDNICVETNSVSLNEEISFSFSIYPNPASKQLTIHCNESLSGRTYVVCDQIGKMIMRGRLENTSTSFSISDLSNGFYTLDIEGHGRRTFIVQKD
jgi:hypothetical protein